MTPKMRNLLNFIVAEIEEVGVAPTYNEMMFNQNIKSKSEIFRLLDCLEHDGYIERSYAKARSIRVIPERERLESVAIWEFLERKGLVREFSEFLDAKRVRAA